MKKYLLSGLALFLATLFTPAHAADSCPNLYLLNGSGSPPVVQGNTVRFVGWGIAWTMDVWLDGVQALLIHDSSVPVGTWFYSGPASLPVSYGTHTLRNGLEACTITFTAVPTPVLPVPAVPAWTGGWDACRNSCITMGSEVLSWDASGSYAPTYYRVDRSDNFGSTWTLDAQPTSPAVFVAIPYGGVRNYRVAACNAAGCSSYGQQIILYYDPNP